MHSEPDAEADIRGSYGSTIHGGKRVEGCDIATESCRFSLMGSLVVHPDDDAVSQRTCSHSAGELVVQRQGIDSFICQRNGAIQQDQIRLQPGVIHAAVDRVSVHEPGVLMKHPVTELMGEQ